MGCGIREPGLAVTDSGLGDLGKSLNPESFKFLNCKMKKGIMMFTSLP